MWTALVFLELVCCAEGLGAREALKEQVAMLRREQWRDRERIESLERKLVLRGERDSPFLTAPEALGDILEEVRREIGELTEDLRQRQELEGTIDALEARLAQGTHVLSELGREVRTIRKELGRLSDEVSTVRRAHPFKKGSKRAHEEGSGDLLSIEEGSGDLESESLIPVETSSNQKIDLKQNAFSIENMRNALKEQAAHIQILEQRIQKQEYSFGKEIDEVENRITQVQEHCSYLYENATESSLVSATRIEDLEDRFRRVRLDMSRVEFNIAQSQAALDVIGHDRASDRERIRDLREAHNTVQIQMGNQRERLIAVELMTTNLTLQRCRAESQDKTRDLKLANMELWLAKADRRFDERVQRSDITRKSDENALRSLREAIVTVSRRTENVSENLHRLASQKEIVRRDLEKFVRQLPRDCSSSSRSGLTLVQVNALGPTEVFCDASTENGPWLLLQRRINGSVNFFRGWAEYREGFGNLDTEFWIGNEIIHRLTDGRSDVKLRVDLWDVLGRYFFAEYERFSVKSEEELYALEVGPHRGNASDALRHHSGMGFSTHDRDNDASSTHCAVHYTGGWWYQHCHRADLNGRYALGMTWYDEVSRDWVQLQRVEMKISTTLTPV